MIIFSKDGSLNEHNIPDRVEELYLIRKDFFHFYIRTYYDTDGNPVEYKCTEVAPEASLFVEKEEAEKVANKLNKANVLSEFYGEWEVQECRLRKQQNNKTVISMD